MRTEDLPTFEQVRINARCSLSDARDWLNSDYRPGAGPNPEQNQARRDALRHIGLAKDALDQAARAAR